MAHSLSWRSTFMKMTRRSKAYMTRRERGPLVALATFSTTAEASVARSALEAAGIPAFVPGETGLKNRGLSGVLPSWEEVQVFESDREEAMRILVKAGHQ